MSDDWNEWGKHVLEELRKNESSHMLIYEKLDKISVNIAKLQVKAGAWGAFGGATSALVAGLILYLKK